MPIRNLTPIESQRFFDREKIPEIVKMIRLVGPLPRIIAVPYQKRIILPDGHNRTVMRAILGVETKRVTLLETEEERVRYGKGYMLSTTTLKGFIENYRREIRKCMLQEGIGSVYDHPIMRYRAEILQRAGIKQ